MNTGTPVEKNILLAVAATPNSWGMLSPNLVFFNRRKI